MSEDANAAEQSMLPLRLNTDDVPEAKSDASDVEEGLGDFGLDTHAEAAMRECRLCKHQRIRTGKAPRKIRNLPSEVTQYHLFRKKGAPIKLCPECDGQAVELALKNHLSREAA